MEKDIVYKIKILVENLNRYADAYYNGESIVTDEEYDKLYNMLESYEKDTGIILSNSPTQKVGYEVKNNLEKIKHETPMLSLGKIHSIEEVCEFIGDRKCIASVKEDGLTIRLTYNNGELIKAETRGDGEIGSDVTHSVKTFTNIPIKIAYTEDLVIDGEAIITDKYFQEINKKSNEGYKNARNLVSGTMALLDANEVKKRHVSFIAWRVVKGLTEISLFGDFIELDKLGFTVVPYSVIEKENAEVTIKYLKEIAMQLGHPYDGIVISYINLDFAKSLGKTEHHFNHSIAYKFEDEIVETVLREIKWSMGRTGDLTPVAIFDPVEIDGTEVSRASCHNVSYLYNMKLGIGDRIGVYKANMIIPQIKENYTNSLNLTIPKNCPVCNAPTRLKKDNESVKLICANEDCLGKLLGKITHYVSKSGMNINGISENTIYDCICNGLILRMQDLYHLKEHKDELLKLDRFGEKKVNKILQAIEDSRTCKLSNFIVALGIPLIGKSASKVIAEDCNDDYNLFLQHMDDKFDWTGYDGFGEEMNSSLYTWWEKHSDMVQDLAQELEFIVEKKDNSVNVTSNVDLQGKTFCITGSLEHFKNRDELVTNIEQHNGKIVSGVSKKTNYLINNDTLSQSSKNKKAKELGIDIISEKDYLKMVGETHE